jgi:hypothetical protein
MAMLPLQSMHGAVVAVAAIKQRQSPTAVWQE